MVIISPTDTVTLLKSINPATLDELSKIIESLKPKTSSGLDGISSKILKSCKSELVEPLLHVVNLSLQQGCFQAKLKSVKVIPLHKRGSKNNIENYRPISLVSSISKIIERVVLAQIFTHHEENKLLTSRQHGFIRSRSTSTAIIELVEHIVDSIEKGNSVIGIFLDQSKAFDCLGHDLILSKLEALGVRDCALEWFSSYLQDQNQIVEINQTVRRTTNSTRSGVRPISRGVPQGSVLGPVLFILFTNDLPQFIEPFSRCVMYADDTVLVTTINTVENVEIDAFISLNLAIEYCSNNDLVFNESKTIQVSFGRGKEQTSDLPLLKSDSSSKYLGIVIDDRLSWQDHVDQLCYKLSSALYAIKRTKAICTKEAVSMAYYALFESHMRYGLVVWGGSSEQNLNRILILQKKAVRLMAGLQPLESCRPIFREWKILTVVNVYIYLSPSCTLFHVLAYTTLTFTVTEQEMLRTSTFQLII